MTDDLVINFQDQGNLFNFLRDLPVLLTVEEAQLLYRLAQRSLAAGVIVEIGSFRGGSAIILAKGVAEGNGNKVYAIDPLPLLEKKLLIKENLKKAGVADRVELIFQKSETVVRNWNKPISLLWIDGSKDYDNPKLDFLAWEKFLIKGGVIAFHDSRQSINVAPNSGRLIPGFVGTERVVKKYLIDSPRFIKIRFIDSITFAKKIKNPGWREIFSRWSFLNRIKIKRKIEKFDQLLGRLGQWLEKKSPSVYRLIKKIKP